MRYTREQIEAHEQNAQSLCDRLGFQQHGESAAIIRQLLAENDALKSRLEIDPRHPIDGIAARDATIKAQDELIDALRAEMVSLYKIKDQNAVAMAQMSKAQLDNYYMATRSWDENILLKKENGALRENAARWREVLTNDEFVVCDASGGEYRKCKLEQVVDAMKG